MQEDFLQYIWQYQLLDSLNREKLLLSDGNTLAVFQPGTHNFDQGPDFLNASIAIEGVQWNGSVEVHIRSSDWYRHQHEGDFNYRNVILHVVWENDRQVYYEDGTAIPTLELHDKTDPQAQNFYQHMEKSTEVPLCRQQLPTVPSLVVNSMLERVLVERLERKTALYTGWWLENDKDWAQTTFEIMAYCLGLKVNALTMRELAHSIPYAKLLLNADEPFRVESLVYGMAGFLDDQRVAPLMTKEYEYQRHKYVLQPRVQKEHWKYARLRPAAFPEVRMGQLIALVLHKQSLFSRLKEASTAKEVQALLKATFQSQLLEDKTPNIGSATVSILVINAVVPLWYLLYRKEDNPEYLNRIFAVLESLPPEDNRKMKKMKSHFRLQNAFDTQSVLELHDHYCTQKKCLDCMMAKSILS